MTRLASPSPNGASPLKSPPASISSSSARAVAHAWPTRGGGNDHRRIPERILRAHCRADGEPLPKWWRPGDGRVYALVLQTSGSSRSEIWPATRPGAASTTLKNRRELKSDMRRLRACPGAWAALTEAETEYRLRVYEDATARRWRESHQAPPTASDPSDWMRPFQMQGKTVIFTGAGVK